MVIDCLMVLVIIYYP